MNCKEVEIVLTDLARNGPIEVEARENVLGHLRVCGPCGERLAAEKRLSEGLLAWGQASMDEQAPPVVEEKLRAAFRARRRGLGRRKWIGIAAVGSIAAGVILFEFVRVSPLTPPPKTLLARQSDGPSIHIIEPPAKPVIKKRQAKRPPQPPHAEPVEVGTDFLPVAQDDGWTPLEGGRLVRVELPKSALGVFGLPIDEERGPERVQADVMVSHDGLLRAIRFVH